MRAGRAMRLAIPLVAAAVVLTVLVVGVSPGPRPDVPPPEPSAKTLELPKAILMFEPPNLVIRSPSGSEIARHEARGFALPLASMSRDGTYFAYWRPTDESRSSFDLVVWRFLGDRLTVLATIRGEAPWAGPIWSSNGEELISAITTAEARPPSLPPASSRLIALKTTGSLREIARYTNQFPPVPVIAGPDFVGGLTRPTGDRSGSYVVIDGRSGRVVREAAAERFRTQVGDPTGDAVLGIARPQEAAGPATLRVWKGSDYGAELARLQLGEVTEGIFRPGRSEIVFGVATGGRFEMQILDHRSGTSRSALRSTDRITPLAFDAGGRWLLVETGGSARYVILDLESDPAKVAATIGSAGFAIGLPAMSAP